MTITTGLLLIFCCLAVSAFTSGSETALVSASRLRIQHMASEGRARAKVALGLLDRREHTLALTLVANATATVAAGAIATALLGRTFGPLGSVIATVAMTAVILVIGEIIPKAFFRYHADTMLVRTASAWRVIGILVLPIAAPAQLVSRVLFRLFRRDPKSLFTTRAEIKLLLEESALEGGIRQHEHELLESALDYAETVALEVMVPISDVALLREDATTTALVELVRERGHTRIPVYRERVDQIVGLCNIFDVLYDRSSKTFLRSYMRPVRLVPDTKPIDALFVEMQAAHENLVVIVNEFGACIGIVSLEDIIEEIFGDIADEHEESVPEIRKLGEGHYRASGMAAIYDLNEEAGWSLPSEGFQTVAGYVLYRLGRIPRRGEHFTDGDLFVRVVDADRYAVKVVEIVQRRRAAEA